MIKTHIQLVMFLMAMDYMDWYKFTDMHLVPIFQLCIKVFAMKQIMSDTQCLYECGYFSEGAQQLTDDSMHYLLTQLRPHMIPLVESFAIES